MIGHLRRAFAWDLQAITVTDRERDRLLAAGVSEGPLHRYAVWRRSCLLIVVFPTSLAAMLATLDLILTPSAGLSRVGTALTVASALVLWAMPVAAILAGRSWARLRRSHRIVSIGWMAAFLPPFAFALVPLDWWFVISGTPEQQADRRSELAILDAIIGISVAITLLPAAVAILPALMRACLRVKTLLPAAILPGWFLVAGAPFYFLLWLVALIALNHLAGSPLLIAGVVLWTGAPMVYVHRADLFVRPLPARDRTAISRVRAWSNAAAIVGWVLLLTYALTKEVFGLRLVGLDSDGSIVWLWHTLPGDGPDKVAAIMHQANSLFWIGDLGFVRLAVEYLGRSLFLTVVFADTLARMNLSLWQQQHAFAGTPEAARYDAVLTDFETVLSRR